MELTRNRAIELIHSTAIELYSKMRVLEENYRSNPASVNYQNLEITKYSNDLKDVIDRMTTFNEFVFLDNKGLELFLNLCHKTAQRFSLKLELPERFTVIEPFTVDGDVIYCHEASGLREAAEYCKKNPQIKKIVLEKDGKGIRLTFNSAEAAKKFLKSETIKTLESMFSKISDGVGILTIIDDESESIENIGTAFTWINVGIDIVKSVYKGIYGYNKYEILDSVADVIIDCFGFAGAPGTIASLQLKYAKKGIPFVAEQLARLNLELENYFLDMHIRFSMLGVK